MADYNEIPQAAIDAAEIPRVQFGQYTKDNFTNHEARISSSETSVLNYATRLNTLDAVTGSIGYSGDSLKTRAAALEALTTNTATNGGQGNARLADRLGTGVGTGTNVTTGSASSQLADVRARATTVETRTLDGTTGNTALGTRASALESNRVGLGTGLWQANAATSLSTTDAPVKFQSQQGTALGISYNNTTGAFTFTRAGVWLIDWAIALSGVQTSSADATTLTFFSSYLAKGSGGAPTGTKYTAPTCVANSGFGGTSAGAKAITVAASDVYYCWGIVSRSCSAAGDARTVFNATWLGTGN